MHPSAVVGNQIQDLTGQSLGSDSVTSFHRFYGDVNGDRRVDISDFGFFSLAYLQPANFNPALDFNNEGRIDISDFGQFSVRFFTTLP